MNIFEGVEFGTQTIELFLTYIVVICFMGMIFDWTRGGLPSRK